MKNSMAPGIRCLLYTSDAADELNRQERIMACIDIYQALTESRPYKSGMTHEAACEILENMVQKGWIDGEITEQIKKCFA